MWYLPESFFLVLAALTHTCHGSISAEYFDEALNIRPLRDGRVVTRFSFTTTLKNALPRPPQSLADDDYPQHYTLFPLSLGQILREYAVTELHLSLNAGKWDYANWGYPEDIAVGTGAELWAWMAESEFVSTDDRWKGLRNALAGLFCASLGSLDDLRTTSPTHSFRPEGSLPRYNQSHTVRHASLPSEHVCTENLTPFLKLLPCKSSAGIASLLNPHRLFDADWHGMAIHVQWNRDVGIVVKLSFQAVLNPMRVSNSRKRDFSLTSLFGRAVTQRCPIARQSVIDLSLPESETYSITPDPLFLHEQIATFNVMEVTSTPLDVHVQWQEAYFSYPLQPPSSPLVDFEVMRTLTGSTQSRGRLSVLIRNDVAEEKELIYLETMPWLVHFDLHTIQLHIDDTRRDDLLSIISYIPPEAHGRPMLFEASLTLPPTSALLITIDVTKSFLRYTEHPPDAQRGWDLPPAVLVPINLTTHRTPGTYKWGQAQLQRIYTPALLVDLATPDFSMPYNVIIMSSTLIALIFGSIFNLLTRRFVAISYEDANMKKVE